MELTLLVVFVLSYFYVTYGINWGEKANISDFNYTVSIRLEDQAGLAYYIPLLSSTSFCVGGIIHEKFILTAAHCFAGKCEANPYKGGYYYTFIKKKTTVYANTNNRESSPEAIERKGEKVYLINEFFETGLDDIGILELEIELCLRIENRSVLSKLTFPSLVESEESSKVGLYKSYDDEKCLIAGFGKDKRPEHDDGSLKKVYSQIYSHSMWPSHDENKFLLARAIKENGDRPDQPMGICTGDSGAPVVLLTSSQPIIIGVVKTCNSLCDSRIQKVPEKYMRVTNYLEFIKHVTSPEANSRDDTSYIQSFNL